MSISLPNVQVNYKRGFWTRISSSESTWGVDLAAAETELRRREQQQRRVLGPEQLRRIQMLGSDLRQVWNATTTTDRDRKELLRTLLEEVLVHLKRAEGRAHLTLRWRGGAITTLDVPVPRFEPMGPHTNEDTISLLRRLAALKRGEPDLRVSSVGERIVPTQDEPTECPKEDGADGLLRDQ